MMGWILDIFNSKKVVEKAADLVEDSVRGVGSWIDEMNFTQEERSQANQRLLDFRLEVLNRTADESSVRSISRRVLAWSVAGVFLTLVMLSAIGTILGFAWAKAVFLIAESVYSSFLAVMSFYFVSQIGNNWIDKTRSK